MLLQGREGNLGYGRHTRGEPRRREAIRGHAGGMKQAGMHKDSDTHAIDTSVIDSLPYRRIVILVNLLVVNGDVLQGYDRMVRCGEVVHIHNCRREEI